MWACESWGEVEGDCGRAGEGEVEDWGSGRGWDVWGGLNRKRGRGVRVVERFAPAPWKGRACVSLSRLDAFLAYGEILC